MTRYTLSFTTPWYRASSFAQIHEGDERRVDTLFGLLGHGGEEHVLPGGTPGLRSEGWQRRGPVEELDVGGGGLPEPLLDGEAHPVVPEGRPASAPGHGLDPETRPLGRLGEPGSVLASHGEPQVAQRPEGQVGVEPVDGRKP